MAMLKDCVCYHEAVVIPRIPEVLTRVVEKAIRGSAPAQFNIPVDILAEVRDVELHACDTPERPPGGQKSTLVAQRTT